MWLAYLFSSVLGVMLVLVSGHMREQIEKLECAMYGMASSAETRTTPEGWWYGLDCEIRTEQGWIVLSTNEWQTR